MSDECVKELPPVVENKVAALDRVFDSIDMIVAKITSGKFIATVMVVFTYCQAINIAGRMVMASKITSETYIALMAGLVALASTIIKDYFNKETEQK